MAVIIQADAFQGLIRKVGYSVGLEDLVGRVTALTRLYAAERRITYAAWEALVVDQFGRKEAARKGQKSATEHIADFFSALNLIKLRNKEITPLQGIESCSILYRYLGEQGFGAALRVILTTYLIESDGDIFLNCMAASFDPDASKQLLESMIENKRALLTKVIRQPALQRRILDVVDIKSQHGQRGDATTPADSSPFARRSVPLTSLTRRESLGVAATGPINISSDYMRKVLPTRKGWARALDLITDQSLNELGSALLESLSRLGYRTGLGPFLVWPFASDLQKLRIAPEDLKCSPLREWDLLLAISKGLGSSVSPFTDEDNHDEVLKLLREIFRLYKEGNAVTGVLRHQIPIFIAQPCVVAINVALGLPIPPLPEIVDSEIRARRINFANIRGTEGGLVVGEDSK